MVRIQCDLRSPQSQANIGLQAVDRDEALTRSKDVHKLPLLCKRPVIEGYTFFDYLQNISSTERIGSGGDYYNYILLPGGRLVVVVAEVFGSGIVGARLLAGLCDEVRSCLALESDPVAAVTHLNKWVCQFYSDPLMTFMMVTLDPATHEATIVRAGLSPPIHRHLDGSLSLPSRDEGGILFGVVEDTEYTAATLTLHPGESLTLFTDGLFNASNTPGKVFTFDRMCEIVVGTNGGPAEVGETLLMQLRQHLGNHPPDDDLCLISFGPVPSATVPYKEMVEHGEEHGDSQLSR